MLNDILMTRGTTPTIIIPLYLTAAQIATITQWYLTIEQGSVKKEQNGSSIALHNNIPYIEVTASQADTLSFAAGPAKCQIRIKGNDGTEYADASDIFDVIIPPLS